MKTMPEASGTKTMSSCLCRYAAAPNKLSAALVVGLTVLTVGCASSFDKPERIDDRFLRERAISRSEDGIRVSAAIPTTEEAQSIFGVNLSEKGIQPLWLEIQNDVNRPVLFLPTGLDPEYFAPLEAAFLFKDSFTDQGNAALAKHIQAISFDSRRRILPGETINGFLYVNQVDPTMVVEIDLVGRKWSQSLDLLVPIPGTEPAQQRLAVFGGLYEDTEIMQIDNEAILRRALEKLPCCMASKTDPQEILPLNLVLIGEVSDIAPALGRRKYRYRSVDPGYVFGREQDFSMKKTSRWVTPQPHTVRIWLTPLRYQGKPAWIAQVSMVRGGRFSASRDGSGDVEPNMDGPRNDLIQDLLYSQSVAKLGFVKGIEPQSGNLRKTPDGLINCSDGLRAVIVFGAEPVSLAEIDFFNWERLADHERQPCRQPTETYVKTN